jgi:hypothetical protein
MKVCKDCRERLPLSAFYANGNMPDGRLSRCKRCVETRYGPGRSLRAKRDRAYFQQIKLERGCVDCGYAVSPVALDFDHRPGETKVYRIACMAGMSRALIDVEVAKCDVRCANCHRIKTAERRNPSG